jgi:hypothetical protein
LNAPAEEDTEGGDITTYGNTSSGDTSNTGVVIWNLVFVAIAACAIICTIIIQNNRLLRAIEHNNVSETNVIKKGKK